MVFDRVRNAIEKLYDGVVTIYAWTKTTDSTTHITSETKTTLVSDQPCRLSFSSVVASINQDGVPISTQTTKLFLSPDISVPDGSELVVTQNGVTNTYERSGKPAVYPTHQEIVVNIKEKVRGEINSKN